jgi:hypothetical protein
MFTYFSLIFRRSSLIFVHFHSFFVRFSVNFADLIVQIYDPNGKVIFEEDRTSGESVAWVAQSPGRYKICWFNTMSKSTAKHVTWELVAGNALQSKDVAKIGTFSAFFRLFFLVFSANFPAFVFIF